MADGFKIADAYVEVEAKLDRAQFQRALEDVVVKVAPRVEQKVKSTVGKKAGDGILSGIKDSFSTGFLKSISAGLAGSGSISGAFSSNPVITAVGVGLAAAIVAVAAPAIGAGLAAAIGAGSALGVIAGGIALIKDAPEVKKAASELGRTLFDIDTTEVKARAQAAQEELTAALRSGNKDRIREARANLAAVRKELAAADKFNRENFSLKDAAAPLIQPVVNSLKIFQDLVKEITPQLSQMFATLDPAIEPLAQGLADLVRNALPGFMKLIESSLPLLDTLAQVLPMIGTTFGTFFEDIAGGSEGANSFLKDFFTMVLGQILVIGKIIKGLSIAYQAMRDFFTSIPGWLSAAGDWFVKIWGHVTTFFSGIWGWITGKGSDVGSWFSDLGATIGDFVSGVGDWFAALPGRIWGFLSSLPGRIGALFGYLFDLVNRTIGFGLGIVYRLFTEAPGKIWGFLSGLPARVAALWTSMWDWIVAKTTAGWNATIAWFALLPGRIGGFFSSLYASVSGWVSKVWTSVTSWVSKTVNDTVAWFAKLPGRAYDAVIGLKDKIMGALSGAGGWLVQVGKDIISGLVSGLSSALGWAVDAAKRAALSIKDGFIDALEIGSPSRLMRREVGRQIPRGVAQGVEDETPGLMDAMRGLVPDMTAAGRGGAATATAATAPAGLVIQNLSIQGVWDFTDPAAVRRMIAVLFDLLNRYQKGYAR